VPDELATVLRVDRKRIVVDTEAGDLFEAQLRGRVARARGRQSSAVAVGDRVRVEREAGAAAIVSIEPRRSVLLRPEIAGRWRRQVLVANADRAVLVFAHADPAPVAGLVDRLLVACHAGDVPPLLVFNKADLAATAETAGLIELYRGLGYEVLLTSAEQGTGIDALAGVLRGRCSVFAGPSGTGKSSLVNRVLPGVELRTGEISSVSGKGRHTTTAAQLVRIPAGGYVIDTPGVKEFGLCEIPPRDLALQFPEFPVPNRCRFLDCLHVTEPGCAVRDALGRREVPPSRYENYCRFLEELVAGEVEERRSGGGNVSGSERAVPLGRSGGGSREA
jgi:ribosome biogenesis GTPase / thiamine phosphate phosphatase